MAEVDASPSIPRAIVIHVAVAEGPTKTKSLLSARVGRRVAEAVGFDRGGVHGPGGIAAHIVESIPPSSTDARKSKQPRIGHARIQAVIGQGIAGMVNRKNGFIETVVAETRFVRPG